MWVRLTTEEFINKARLVHGDKYLYDKLVYTYNRKKVIITCPTHGDFEQNAGNHLQGYGCAKCSGIIRLTQEEFITKSKELWGENSFDYSKVKYKNNSTKITLICKKHNIEFEQLSGSHIRGTNCCPECIYEKQDDTREVIGHTKDVTRKQGNMNGLLTFKGTMGRVIQSV